MRRALPVANRKNMREAFARDIEHDDRVSIHGLDPLFRKAEDAYEESEADEAMAVANKRLLGHGVEAIRGRTHNRYFSGTVALYVNMGDPYVSTIIYDIPANRFYVGGYGDWVEWRESNRDYGLGTFDE